jgi:hypothetical protein
LYFVEIVKYWVSGPRSEKHIIEHYETEKKIGKSKPGILEQKNKKTISG